MTKFERSLCILWCVCWVQTGAHHVVLDRNDKFHLTWETREDIITLKAEVATKGYVGFGLSPNGGMAGSDIVIGWVKDGKIYFHDRYAKGNSLPSIDKQQDWKLVSGSENVTHTVLQFKRKLQTCDSEDLPITNDTMRVIYSYHNEDQRTKTRFLTMDLRIVELVASLFCSQNYRIQRFERILNTGTHLLKLTINGTEDTMYWCKIMKAPILPSKHHVVKVSPVIQKEHEGNVHHMILYQCLGATVGELEPYTNHNGHICYHPNMPPVFGKCGQPYSAWGIGGEDMILPEHVGMPFGEEGTNYFMIEIHYDNPSFKNGVLDDSGMRLYYTPKLRMYDAATLMFGSEVSWEMFIPPREEHFTVVGHCDTRCLQPVLPENGIKAIAVILHSHLLGRALKLRQFRNNTELPPIASDNHYDFNYQEYHYLKPEITIRKGDHLTAECVYNSQERNSTTVGGLGTKQEMCLAYVLYYPQIKLNGCTSIAMHDTLGKIFGIELQGPEITSPKEYANQSLYTFLTNHKWTNKMGIQELTRMGPHAVRCLREFNNQKVFEPVTYPPITAPYAVPNPCQGPPEASSVNLKPNSNASGIRNLSTSLSQILLLLLYFNSLKK